MEFEKPDAGPSAEPANLRLPPVKSFEKLRENHFGVDRSVYNVPGFQRKRIQRPKSGASDFSSPENPKQLARRQRLANKTVKAFEALQTEKNNTS